VNEATGSPVAFFLAGGHGPATRAGNGAVEPFAGIVNDPPEEAAQESTDPGCHGP